MDRNPLLQGLQNPCAEVGVISGKGCHDEELLADCERNASNGAVAIYCFPGGNQPINHDAMPGYTALGMKNVRLPESDVFEIGVVSAAGICWDNYCSQRQMEAQFYWQGIVTTEQHRTKPLDSTTDDPPHGYGTLRAGTKSIINNSWKTIYAGDRLVWRFPKAPFHPKAGDTGNRFNGGDNINYLARQGEPPTQFRFEYEAYDPTDFSVQMAAAYAALSLSKAEGGVSDLPYQNAFPWAAAGPGVKDRPWSSIQEEALAYKFAFWGIGLTLIDTLKEARVLTLSTPSGAEIAKMIGLFDGKAEGGNEKVVNMGVADILLDKMSPVSDDYNAMMTRFEKNNTMNFFSARMYTASPDKVDSKEFLANLRVHMVDMLAIGMTSALESARSQIVGVAMNSAAPADTMHVLWGHFTA